MSQLQEETAQAPAIPDAPYVGLRDYTAEYADLFFGRDSERTRIIGNLRAARLTLLYAESGVGKSSLLRAGVVPRVLELAERDRGERSTARFIPVVFSSWGSEPAAALIDAIGDAIAPFAGGVQLPDDSLDSAISAATEATGATMLIILDQFEEIFLYHSRDSHDDVFAEQLARCINHGELRANFLISIREDAYAGIGDLLNGRVTNVYGNYLHLDYLDRASARDAIVRPIERLNERRAGELGPGETPFTIEPALVESVLDQVRHGLVVTRGDDQAQTGRPVREGADRIETTYLQLVMKRLWEEEMAGGSRVLRLGTLERLGGAQTIIATHLDQSMAALPDDQQRAAASVFRFLVTSAGTKIALTLEDLAELSGLSGDALEPMLRRLSAPDLHILRPVAIRDAPDRARFEIFHDALARPILDWRLRYTRRLQEAELAAELEHERAQRELAESQAQEAERREARERRRKRFAVAALIVAVGALLVTAVSFAVYQKRDADRQKREARAQTAFAQSVDISRRIGARAGSPSVGPQTLALASVEASRLAKSFAAHDVALGVLQSNVAMPRIAVGHTRSVLAVAFVSDSVLASGSADGTVRLWDERGNAIGEPLTTQNAIVASLAANTRDGRTLLAAGRGNGTVDLWDVTDGAEAQRPERTTITHSSAIPPPIVTAVAFSPDGRLLAVGAQDGRLTLWDVSEPGDPRQLHAVLGFGWVRGLAFDGGGARLAIASDNGVAELAGPDFAEPSLVWRDRVTDSASVAFAPDGSLAYALGNVNQPGIAVLDAGGERSATFVTTAVVASLAFTPDGSVLVAGGFDANVTTWDMETGRPFGAPRTQEFNYGYRSVAVALDGQTIAGAGDFHLVKMWPLIQPEPLASIIGSLGPDDVGAAATAWQQPWITGLALGSGGQVAAAANAAGAIIWDSEPNADESGAPIPATVIAVDPGDFTVQVAYHEETLAVGVQDDNGEHAVTLWDTGSSCAGMPRAACALGELLIDDRIGSMVFDRTGAFLAVGTVEGEVEIWDVADPRAATMLYRKSAGTLSTQDLVFSPTDDLLAIGNDDGTLQLWHIGDNEATTLGKPVVGHLGHPVSAIAFSPDGKILASGGLDQQVALWTINPRGPDTLRRRPGGFYQTNSILSLAFSKNGKVLASGDGDGSTCMYGVANQESYGGGSCLSQHYSGANLSGIFSLVFLPDGTLLSAGRSNPVIAWDPILWSGVDDAGSSARVGELVCDLARRNLTEDEWDDAFVGTLLEDERRETCPDYALD